MKKAFKLPEWTTPAIAFNNTTSLPLLLVQSLSVTGILDAIDSSPNVVDKAKAFFLVNAMVGNSLTFALGPKLLNGQEEDAPDAKKDEGEEERRIEEQGEEAVEANERTSLLPGSIVRPLTRAGWKGYGEGRKVWIQLPGWAQRVLDFLAQFCNAPLIGAAIGIIIGIVPELHRLFFVSLSCVLQPLLASDAYHPPSELPTIRRPPQPNNHPNLFKSRLPLRRPPNHRRGRQTLRRGAEDEIPEDQLR